MSDQHHFVRLRHFGHERFGRLKVLSKANFEHIRIHQVVIRFGQRNARKEIADDTIEERNIVRQEFRQIDVDDTSEDLKAKRIFRTDGGEADEKTDENIFIFGWILLFQRTSSPKDGFDCTHTVIVVILGRQLFCETD